MACFNAHRHTVVPLEDQASDILYLLSQRNQAEKCGKGISSKILRTSPF